MSAQDIQAYLDARTVEQDARRRAEELVKEVADAANKLQRWNRVTFANANIGYPAGLSSTYPQLSIDAKRWPSAQQVAQALSDWHTAVHEANNAFDRVPAADRGGLKPPPPRS